MSRKDFFLYAGETWTIDGIVNDGNGLPVDMTSGTVEFRLCSPSACVLKLLSPADITILAGTGGTYKINLPAADIRQKALTAGVFDYEVDAITADGGVTVQNNGKITLDVSKRLRFP